jgi:Ca-activated chloride channel family protein
MKKIIFILIFLLINLFIYSDNISISGIDTQNMIFNGNISLYLSITDDLGIPKEGITAESLQVLESIDNLSFSEREIVSFSEGENARNGINVQLLIDNSGSMYDQVDGTETDIYEQTRIYSALSAIKTLINSMKGSEDNAGVSSFNTYYKELVPMSSNRNLVLESLQMIDKPGKDESFTELNGAVYFAAGKISSQRGRKIIIVLSDGENYPYSVVRKEDSPQFGSKLYTTDDMISELKLNSATLYGINFGAKRDKSLEKAAIETGGFLYEVDNEKDLALIYQNIRERVLSEYYLEYNTNTVYAEKKFAKAILRNDSTESGSVFYFSGSIFGKPSLIFNWFFLVALPLAILLLLLLAFQKLSNPAVKPELEITDFSGSTQIFDLKDSKTVIGTSDSDDITLATNKNVTESTATIVYDEKKSVYTVVSDKNVLVNNNPVKTRILEPGDVISIDGATIIFNDKE